MDPPAFPVSEFTVDAAGPSTAFFNGTPTAFAPTFLPFANIQVDGATGSAPVPSEPQVPKLVVVDNLLERVLQTTKDARDAYSRGQDAEGSQRVAELKAVVDLVSTFVQPSNTPLKPPSASLLLESLPHPPINDQKRVTPPSATASRKASLTSLSQSHSALEDTSRKRCASAQGDRVVKSLKLEPKEEPLPVIISAGPSSGPPSAGLSGSLAGTPTSSISAPPAPAMTQAPAPPPLIHAQTFPSGMRTLGLNAQSAHVPIHIGHPTPFPLEPAVAPGATLVQQLAVLQHPPHPPPQAHPHAQPHPPVLSHRARVPSLHSSLVLGTVQTASGNPSPSATQPPSGWPDPASLIQASQVMIPPQAPRFRPPDPPQTRPARSSSYSGAYPFSFSTSNTTVPAEDAAAAAFEPERPSTGVSVADSSSPELEAESEPENSPGRAQVAQGGSGRSTSGTSGSSTEGAHLASHPSNDIPHDLRVEVDQIFFKFLNTICSDLDATDNKGEPIHQPLMAKKMQRLDESPDFRPFKFRIQAFTNGFLEELAKQGLPEEIIPMKKVRHYLWTNSYISRFNEDGKKAKSKGNHIWNIDAKKAPEGGWLFRPFRRKIAGSFPGVAYVGLRWQFQPRVWDPQASRSNLHVRFTSPSLPPWLSWNGDVLSGTPSADTPSTEIVVDARFMQDGNDMALSQKYFLSVAPLSREEPGAYMGSRRQSLVGDRRILSDSAVAHTANVLPRIPPPPPLSSVNTAAPYQEALTVVTEAIKAVSIEVRSVHVSPNPDPEQQIQLETSLTRQEQVLTVTAHAINDTMSGTTHPASSVQQAKLARAGTDVVISALHKVAADHSMQIMASPGTMAAEKLAAGISMLEVSSATKSAVAQAVEQTNRLTSPIDVMITAENIIAQAMPGPTSQQPPPQPQQPQQPQQQPFGPDVVGGGGGGGVVVQAPPGVLSSPFSPEVPVLADYAMVDIPS